jgi:hypothetical protein
MANQSGQSDKGLTWVVQFSSALSLGVLAGFLYSVKAVVPSIRFEVTVASFVAFLLAAGVSFLLWHVVFQLTAAQEQPAGGQGSIQTRRRKLWLKCLAGGLTAALIFAFIYPLKDFSSEKAAQIAFGALVALLFLSVLGIVFWRVVRFLEADEKGHK